MKLVAGASYALLGTGRLDERRSGRQLGTPLLRRVRRNSTRSSPPSGRRVGQTRYHGTPRCIWKAIGAATSCVIIDVPWSAGDIDTSVVEWVFHLPYSSCQQKGVTSSGVLTPAKYITSSRLPWCSEIRCRCVLFSGPLTEQRPTFHDGKQKFSNNAPSPKSQGGPRQLMPRPVLGMTLGLSRGATNRMIRGSFRRLLLTRLPVPFLECRQSPPQLDYVLPPPGNSPPCLHLEVYERGFF